MKSIFHAISSAMLDLTRVFSSETAGLLAPKQTSSPKINIPQGPVSVVFLQNDGDEVGQLLSILMFLFQKQKCFNGYESECQMERKGGCKKVKSSIYGKISRVCESIWPKGVFSPCFTFKLLECCYLLAFHVAWMQLAKNHDERDAF